MSKEKYQQALNTLFIMSSEHLGFELNYKKNLLQELVDIYPEYLELKAKVTPMKPAGYHTDYNCPTCNKRVRSGKGSSSRIKDTVCRNCYQVLDWSE